MKQIFQTFAVILPFTTTLCLAMAPDQTEKPSINHGAYSVAIFDKNSRGSILNEISSVETSPVTWRDKKDPVDLSSFLGLKPSSLHFCSYKASEDSTAAKSLQEMHSTKKRATSNGSAAFVKMYYAPKKPTTQAPVSAPAIQSRIGLQNVAIITPAGVHNKKRKLTQSSLLNFINHKKHQKMKAQQIMTHSRKLIHG